MNIDNKVHNIIDDENKKTKLENKRKKRKNNSIDVYKLELAKISIFNHHLTICEYICFMLCCIKKKKNLVYILEQFRKKLISEEHFFKANIFLCLAEKFLPLNSIGKRIDLVELYENL